MKRKRLSELRREFDRALEAAQRGEWWNGKRWVPDAELPRTEAEARAYKTPFDVMEEANRAMISDGEPDSDERLSALRRFERSAEADREERSASTPAEADAEMIFQAAKPFLGGKRTPWTKLALRLSLERKKEITPNRLRMICRQRGKK